MANSIGAGLARVTVAAPNRRIDVALPDQVPAAELLPGLLHHAGEELADSGQAHGGWVLRRADGSQVDGARTLAAQNVRDGEVLHLAARRTEWPELDYDDVVDAIATGARRHSRAWTGRATRAAGLATGAGLLLLGLVLLAVAGAGALVPGSVALAVGAILVLGGIVLSRALADSGAGAVLAAVALPYAFAGGVLVTGPDEALTRFGPPQLLAGSAVLLLASVTAFAGVADRGQVFVAGALTGLLGAIAAVVAMAGQGAAGSAAVAISLALALVPAMPLLSIRLGKLPMPALPVSAEDLRSDPPQPSRPRVYGAVVRADELLTGMLTGAGLVSAVSAAVLALSGDVTAAALVLLVAFASMLRARLFPTIRHRLPLLLPGLAGVAAIAAGPALAPYRIAVVVPLLVAGAAVAVVSALVYSRKTPSPYLGRLADVFDTLLVIAVVPVACGVLGLYGYVRGLDG